MFQWKIYYGDFSTFSDKDGSPYDAPGQNVQMIARADPEHGWYLVRGCDYYWYDAKDKMWYSGDFAGMLQQLLQPGPQKILLGRCVMNHVYEKILCLAMDDPEIPQKTGYRPGEPR